MFADLLGPAYARLPASVRALHDAELPASFVGRAWVEPAQGRLARLAARLAGLPVVADEVDTQVRILATDDGQRWQRRFAGRAMNSKLWREGSLVCERLGLTTLRFRLHGDTDGIRWELVSVRALGLPLPRRWFAQVHAQESEQGGHYRFSVAARLPLLGHLIAYDGWLEPAPQPATATPVAIIVFDGVCHLCNGWVDFLLKRDRAGRYRFAAMQSASGRELLLRHGLDADDPVSFLLIDRGRAFTDTDAILRVLVGLGGAWRAIAGLRALPRFLRDPLYRRVARHRYRLFGRRDACRVPDPGFADRFL